MILDALILQTKLLLQDDMEITVNSVQSERGLINKLNMKNYTSMIGTGGKLSLLVIISFDNTMINKLVDVFMEGVEMDPNEELEIKDSVAGEMINTLMGLALPTFPGRGKGVTITPPITINDASTISKHKNSTIATAEITTNFGQFSISIIDSKNLNSQEK